MSDADLREEIMEIYGLPDWLRERWRAIRQGASYWMAQDWTVEAGGYRLVIKNGAMLGLAYDEFPWPWGDPRYDEITVVDSRRGSMADPFPDSRPLTAADLDACPQPEPPPDSPYRFFALTPLYVSEDGVHFYRADGQ